MASLLAGSTSYSRHTRRHWVSHANVRSTTQRRGSTTKPFISSERNTGWRIIPHCVSTQSTSLPRYVPSTPIRRSFFPAPPSRENSNRAPAGSETEAAVTTTIMSKPIVSIRICRLRPVTFLPESWPRIPGIWVPYHALTVQTSRSWMRVTTSPSPHRRT